MKTIFNAIIKRIFMNWKHPRYSKGLFTLCAQYVDFCYGDNNFNRETNGENRVVRAILPRCQTVFDVGANDGQYSRYALSINPDTEIHAFEPGKQAFQTLKSLPLVANNFAIGDKREKKTLFCDTRKSTHNSLYNLIGEKSARQEVMVDTLDNYCLTKKIEHIDFLKIDVEGYEFFVLQGGQNMFRDRRVDFIQFEFSGASIESRAFLKDFMEFFTKYGYDLYRIKPSSIEKVIYSPAKERFTLTNYLAMNRSVTIPNKLNAENHDF